MPEDLPTAQPRVCPRVTRVSPACSRDALLCLILAWSTDGASLISGSGQDPAVYVLLKWMPFACLELRKTWSVSLGSGAGPPGRM